MSGVISSVASVFNPWAWGWGSVKKPDPAPPEQDQINWIPVPFKISVIPGPFTLPSDYGFVVLTAVGSVIMIKWMAMKVEAAREEFNIPYPQQSTDNVAFNCIQGAYQNTLEEYPQFLLCLMIGGLEMPCFSAAGGWIWIIGKALHANVKGYYSGDPTNWARRTLPVAGMGMLMAATCTFAIKQLRR